eukprot:394975-Hanusia_phi.AAC.1
MVKGGEEVEGGVREEDKEVNVSVREERGTETIGQKKEGEEADAWEGLEEGWIMWYMSKGLEEEEV